MFHLIPDIRKEMILDEEDGDVNQKSAHIKKYRTTEILGVEYLEHELFPSQSLATQEDASVMFVRL